MLYKTHSSLDIPGEEGSIASEALYFSNLWFVFPCVKSIKLVTKFFFLIIKKLFILGALGLHCCAWFSLVEEATL